MGRLKYPYIWLFCAFAALGAFQYGYDGRLDSNSISKLTMPWTHPHWNLGVYFSGIQAMSTFVRDFGSRQADGTYAISPLQLSIMSSMINVGELVGSLGAAPLNDLFGRKGAFFLGAVAAIVGTVLQVITDHEQGLVTGGRVVLGLGVGIYSSTSPLYMGVCFTPIAHLSDIEHKLIGDCTD